jgi:hypothetical protein
MEAERMENPIEKKYYSIPPSQKIVKNYRLEEKQEHTHEYPYDIKKLEENLIQF